MIVQIEIPDVVPDANGVLSTTEVDAIRRIFAMPEYVKLVAIAERYRPSANLSWAGSGNRDAFSDARANARLGEIRGWELYRAAFVAALTPPRPREHIVENFQPVGPQVDGPPGTHGS